MNKHAVVAAVAAKTNKDYETARNAVNALEKASATIVSSRLRGISLENTAALSLVSEATGLSGEQALTLIKAFEEVLGEGLGEKLRFGRKAAV